MTELKGNVALLSAFQKYLDLVAAIVQLELKATAIAASTMAVLLCVLSFDASHYFQG